MFISVNWNDSLMYCMSYKIFIDTLVSCWHSLTSFLCYIYFVIEIPKHKVSDKSFSRGWGKLHEPQGASSEKPTQTTHGGFDRDKYKSKSDGKNIIKYIAYYYQKLYYEYNISQRKLLYCLLRMIVMLLTFNLSFVYSCYFVYRFFWGLS